MASVNKVIIIGNLGRDPEAREANGQTVCSLSVATTRKWKDKQGEAQEETEWHRVVFWGRQAEIAEEHLRKGSAVYIEGRLKTRKWQDKDGQDRYTTEIVGEIMQFMGGREDKGRGDRDDRDTRGGRDDRDDRYSRNDRGSNRDRPDARAPSNAKPPRRSSDDFEDDIPFD